MSSKRFHAEDYSFNLRLLQQGCLLTSENLGVALAFSSIAELHDALMQFQEQGIGIIAVHIRKAHGKQKKEKLNMPVDRAHGATPDRP